MIECNQMCCAKTSVVSLHLQNHSAYTVFVSMTIVSILYSGHEIRQNKGAILRETIVYIRALRAYLAGLEQMEERAEELNRTNETIILRIQVNIRQHVSTYFNV